MTQRFEVQDGAEVRQGMFKNLERHVPAILIIGIIVGIVAVVYAWGEHYPVTSAAQISQTPTVTPTLMASSTLENNLSSTVTPDYTATAVVASTSIVATLTAQPSRTPTATPTLTATPNFTATTEARLRAIRATATARATSANATAAAQLRAVRATATSKAMVAMVAVTAEARAAVSTVQARNATATAGARDARVSVDSNVARATELAGSIPTVRVTSTSPVIAFATEEAISRVATAQAANAVRAVDAASNAATAQAVSAIRTIEAASGAATAQARVANATVVAADRVAVATTTAQSINVLAVATVRANSAVETAAAMERVVFIEATNTSVALETAQTEAANATVEAVGTIARAAIETAQARSVIETVQAGAAVAIATTTASAFETTAIIEAENTSAAIATTKADGVTETPQLSETSTPEPTLSPFPTQTPSIDEIVSREIDNLKEGTIAFTPPQTLTVGIPQTILASIIRSTIEQDVNRVIEGLNQAQEPGNRIAPETREINVSSVMKVQLSGSNEQDFKIIPSTIERQPVGRTGSTEWRWEVTPLRAGRDKILILNVHAVITIRYPDSQEFHEEEKSVEVLRREIRVRVNPIYTARVILENYWQWLIGTILTSLGILAAFIPLFRRGSLPIKPKGYKQQQKFQQALLSAFASEADLRQMVQHGLSLNLSAIAGGDDLNAITFNLVMWAKQHGRMDELVRAAYQENPGNVDLKAFVESHLGELPE